MSVPEPSKARPAPKETAPLDAADTWTQDRAMDSGAEQQGTHEAQFCLHPSHRVAVPTGQGAAYCVPAQALCTGSHSHGADPSGDSLL